MGRKSFKAPKAITPKKDMKVGGIKNSGGGGVKNPNPSPHSKKTNP